MPEVLPWGLSQTPESELVVQKLKVVDFTVNIHILHCYLATHHHSCEL